MKIESMIKVLEASRDDKENSWIPHDGKSFPTCQPDDLIEVDQRKLGISTSIRAADTYNWRHKGGKHDVVFWRLVE